MGASCSVMVVLESRNPVVDLVVRLEMLVFVDAV
jgi:hypothetical protein